MSRNTWAGRVSYGPVSFAATMASVASDSNSIETHMYSPAGNRLRQQYVDEKTLAPVPYHMRKRCYEAPDGSLVTITDDDFEQAFGETLRSATIDMFASPGDIPDEARRRPFRLQPAVITRGKGRSKRTEPDPGSVRAYAFLAETLRVTGTVGVVVFGVRERKRIAVIEQRDGYLLLTPLEFAEDMPGAEFTAPQADITEADLEMGRLLVNSKRGAFSHAEYRDTSRAEIEAVVARRIELGITERPAAEADLAAAPELEAGPEAPTDMTAVLGDYLAGLASERSLKAVA